MNERFGTDFTDDRKVFIQRLENQLEGNDALKASFRVSPPENARLSLEQVMDRLLQEMVSTNFKFYKRVTDDRQFGQYFLNWLFERFTKSVGGGP